MRVPNAGLAEIPEAKITRYLLNEHHRSGRGRARFFRSHGFTLERRQELAEALARHVKDHKSAASRSSEFGVRYVVEGPMGCPDGRAPNVRSVWFIRTTTIMPSLVTAYPLGRTRLAP